MGKIKNTDLISRNVSILIKDAPDLIDFDNETPIFSFRYLDKKHCLSKLEKNEKAGFDKKIDVLSQLTWKQIKSIGRHENGFEKISRDSIKARIPTEFKQTEKGFIAFRFYDKKPMIGVREGRKFFIIWLDCNYTVYDHN
jgi:hypothetical protein